MRKRAHPADADLRFDHRRALLLPGPGAQPRSGEGQVPPQRTAAGLPGGPHSHLCHSLCGAVRLHLRSDAGRALHHLRHPDGDERPDGHLLRRPAAGRTADCSAGGHEHCHVHRGGVLWRGLLPHRPVLCRLAGADCAGAAGGAYPNGPGVVL